ncbi:hypothetical protein HMPREF9078_02368, partial [Capnocytophaga sp. oral taxon 380 str. F0488]
FSPKPLSALFRTFPISSEKLKTLYPNNFSLFTIQTGVRVVMNTVLTNNKAILLIFYKGR